jgi:tight adherence protein C
VTAILLGGAWGGLVLAVAWRRRPPPARLQQLAAAVPMHGGVRRRPAGAAVAALGRLLRRALRRPPDPAADARIGAAAAAAMAALPLWVPLAPLVGAAVWAWPGVAAERAGRRRQEAAAASLPEVVDLFALAVAAGLTVPLALAAVARRAAGPLGDGLRRAAGEVALGRRTADALDDLAADVEPARPLTSALAASERYGIALGPSLERLAAEVRAQRRRRSEEAARRVPVKLLFPLVLCTLPAFALLTVAPLIAGALETLRL